MFGAPSWTVTISSRLAGSSVSIPPPTGSATGSTPPVSSSCRVAGGASSSGTPKRPDRPTPAATGLGGLALDDARPQHPEPASFLDGPHCSGERLSAQGEEAVPP